MQVGGKLAHVTQVLLLGLRGELAHAHVFHHASPQRRDVLLLLRKAHDSAPGDKRGGLPHLATYGTDKRSPKLSLSDYLQRSHPYRASGLVRWPDSDCRSAAPGSPS